MSTNVNKCVTSSSASGVIWPSPLLSARSIISRSSSRPIPAVTAPWVLPSGFPVASQWLPSGPASSVMVSPNSLETLLRFFRLIVLQKNHRKRWQWHLEKERCDCSDCTRHRHTVSNRMSCPKNGWYHQNASLKDGHHEKCGILGYPVSDKSRLSVEICPIFPDSPCFVVIKQAKDFVDAVPRLFVALSGACQWLAVWWVLELCVFWANLCHPAIQATSFAVIASRKSSKPIVDPGKASKNDRAL